MVAHRVDWHREDRSARDSFALLVDSHLHHARRILTRLGSGTEVSQRSLARELGIALGLTNLLIRRMARKGWIQIVRTDSHRVRYLVTPTGIAVHARMTQAYLRSSMRFYAEARDRIRARFETLSNGWVPRGSEADSRAVDKRVVFLGAGEVAEIGYVCIQGTDLHLVGVVDDRRARFFDVPIFSRKALGRDAIAGHGYDRLIVMSFADGQRLRANLADLDIEDDRLFWL